MIIFYFQYDTIRMNNNTQYQNHLCCLRMLWSAVLLLILFNVFCFLGDFYFYKNCLITDLSSLFLALSIKLILFWLFLFFNFFLSLTLTSDILSTLVEPISIPNWLNFYLDKDDLNPFDFLYYFTEFVGNFIDLFYFVLSDLTDGSASSKIFIYSYLLK